ncbi:Pyridoxal phosphate homeostasis protein [Paenibacillus sp. JJ-100]|uniref:YggS family pyridoxal phosphate-dependent enzyme n=1 Tax=Paenibacillus sp. JJ-100 TaxID=2974896 RepID=UPI0022FF5AB7|nr:YggS family pyridoxal phosphate-dependent enzyme [Paenibacillus sp. JJ-100]CAI6069580.1 Pyridoxal phosphate homeostasis protein [Paenibacillus sp. JJ-100]
MSLEERVQQVNQKIEDACKRSNRRFEDVNVIAVTKYVSLQTTGAVLDHGLEHIGENRWQDAQAKWEAFGQKGIWHFIGHLQTNKVKDVIGKFAYIHSLDRLSLAKELNKKAASLGIKVNTFMQVNISGEESKYGLQPEQASSFLKDIQSFDNLKVIGLMTMAPYEEDPEMTRPVFRGLRELRDELNGQALTTEPITELSMGMSNDFEVAIEEGATWVRLGSILVGKEESTRWV